MHTGLVPGKAVDVAVQLPVTPRRCSQLVIPHGFCIHFVSHRWEEQNHRSCLVIYLFLSRGNN